MSEFTNNDIVLEFKVTYPNEMPKLPPFKVRLNVKITYVDGSWKSNEAEYPLSDVSQEIENMFLGYVPGYKQFIEKTG